MAVDRQRVIETVTRLELVENGQGLIPGLGVYLTTLPAQLYNRLSYRFEQAFGVDGHEESARRLVNCAHVCGYNTFHGIWASKEWQAGVDPLIHTPEDRIEASIAVCDALGWARMHVSELGPEGGVFTAERGYESSGYISDYGRSDHPICYKLCGALSALFDLTYGASYPDSIYGYHAQEVTCRAMGDDLCTFVVSRASDHSEG